MAFLKSKKAMKVPNHALHQCYKQVLQSGLIKLLTSFTGSFLSLHTLSKQEQNLAFF